MKFDYFVLPFLLGLIYMIVVIISKYAYWFRGLNEKDRLLFRRLFISKKFFAASGEILRESLLHNKVFKKNVFLGFMHASLAFGWFLLILIGNMESRIHSPTGMNPPYVPIFFKFFIQNDTNFIFADVFSFLMDVILLIVLIGVLLALYKRIWSKFFGMKKTTKQKRIDKYGLISLWCIFPLRFLAESATAAIYDNGSFLTDFGGKMISSIVEPNVVFYLFWWMYSISLGLFFVFLPYTRYLHIPSEIYLIIMKFAGIKTGEGKKSLINLHASSCSRCGICIDQCQIQSTLDFKEQLPLNYMKEVRFQKPHDQSINNCLMCGRCEQSCPVGIEINNIRLLDRIVPNIPDLERAYLKMEQNTKSAKIIYFAGCMGHLTPGTQKAFFAILKQMNIEFEWVDSSGSICCGRPLKLAGREAENKRLVEENSNLFHSYNAEYLITSCPICLTTLKSDYQLNMNVLHHSQFLKTLFKNLDNKVIKKPRKKIFYHDPCELSRSCEIVEEPRKLLAMFSEIVSSHETGLNSLCCGGSLGNMNLSEEQKNKVTQNAISSFMKHSPEVLVTSCPLCKKTFSKFANIPVQDISEFILDSLPIDKKIPATRLKHFLEM